MKNAFDKTPQGRWDSVEGKKKGNGKEIQTEEKEMTTEEATAKTLHVLAQSQGYGHLMMILTALWRIDAEKEGLPKEIAFLPTIKEFIVAEHRDRLENEAKNYEKYINRILDEGNEKI